MNHIYFFHNRDYDVQVIVYASNFIDAAKMASNAIRNSVLYEFEPEEAHQVDRVEKDSRVVFAQVQGEIIIPNE